MKLRVKKLPIILPLLILAAILAGTAVRTLLSQKSASDHTNLGQIYLNDLNYTGAITEFLQSLSLDPTAQDARLGLAEAYIASGSSDMVADILQPMIDANDPSAYRLLLESQQDSDPRQALLTAQTLVEYTDLPEDYARRDQLFLEVLTEPHSYASGIDQSLLVLQDGVYSAGSNTLGQLGTEQAIATESIQDAFRSAQFSGQAARVYCAGRTSCVVDQDGNLWAAGENRWGQMGLNYAAMDPQSGWIQLTDSGDVAAVAGTIGTLFVLKTDGSLWYAGQGSVMQLQRVTDFGMVCAIASNNRQTAVLTVDGALYVNDANAPTHWTRQAGSVKTFCLSDSRLVWVTQSNQINSVYGIPQVPDTWTWTSQGVTPGFAVRDIAVDETGMLLLDSTGRLHRLYNGQVYELEGETAANIYADGDHVVVEQEDGSVLLWDLSQSNPEPVM